MQRNRRRGVAWCTARLLKPEGRIAMVTLGESARLTGLGKTTLARAIKGGRLSATKTDLGSYQIDPAELARVYPFPAPVAAGATVSATGSSVHDATPGETPAVTAAPEAQIAGLRDFRELLLRQLDDVRDDRDRWRGQAERLALAAPVTTPAPAQRPWWKRIAG